MSENIVEVPGGQRHFSIMRTFDAPRTLIYRCYTEPRHMARFWGPRGTTLETCRIDLRVGGVWAVRWRFPDGTGWGYASVYLDIVPDVRIHYRDAPDDWPGGLDGLPDAELITTIALSETDGRTTVAVSVVCASVAARDEAIQRGFTGMVSVGNDRLAEYLETLDRPAA